MIEILERLKIAMAHLNIKQTDLSELTGIASSTLSGMFTKGREPNPKIFQILNSEYGVDCNWLITGKGEMFVGEPAGFSVTHSANGVGNVVQNGNAGGLEINMLKARIKDLEARIKDKDELIALLKR